MGLQKGLSKVQSLYNYYWSSHPTSICHFFSSRKEEEEEEQGRVWTIEAKVEIYLSHYISRLLIKAAWALSDVASISESFSLRSSTSLRKLLIYLHVSCSTLDADAYTQSNL